MKRKVIRQGHNTLTVTLPSRWCKANNISSGDEIEVRQDRDDLVIASKARPISLEANIFPKTYGRLLRRMIYNLYRAGYDKILIRYDDIEAVRATNRCIEDLMGFDIIRQGRKSLELQKIASLDYEKFNNIFRRYFRLTLNIAQSSYEASKRNDFEELAEIAKMEKVQNKLFNYCTRLVNIRWDQKDIPATKMHMFIRRLEDIADDYKYICVYLSKNNVRCEPKVVELLKKANQYLKDLYDLYYEPSTKKAHHVNEYKKVINLAGFLLLEKAGRKNVMVVHKVLEINTKIYDAADALYTRFIDLMD